MQCLHIAVLREKRHRQYPFACQHHIQVLKQSETGFFQGLYSGIGAIVGVLHVVLHRRFHCLQQERCLGLAHHIQGTCRLVQLLFGHAQRTAVQRG